DALLNGYAAYQDYEECRKQLAVKISDELNKHDYKSAVRYSNRMMTHDPLLDVQRFEPKFKINTGTNGIPDKIREFFVRLKKVEYKKLMKKHDPQLDVKKFEPKFKINTDTNGRPDTTREFFERLKKEEV